MDLTINELIERLDHETSHLGEHLRAMMSDDDSDVEDTYTTFEGFEEGEHGFKSWVIKSFIVWTGDYIYHSVSDDLAFLYEDGHVFKVPRYPREEIVT